MLVIKRKSGTGFSLEWAGRRLARIVYLGGGRIGIDAADRISVLRDELITESPHDGPDARDRDNQTARAT